MLDFNDLMAVELKGDNLRALLTDWDLVLGKITNVPNDEQLESFLKKQLRKSEQFAPSLHLYEFDIKIISSTISYYRFSVVFSHDICIRSFD